MTRYHSDPRVTAVREKAGVLAAKLRMGPGKLDAITALLTAALALPCTYCRGVVDLDSASVDHIEPARGVRGKAVGAVAIALDRIENLQIVCRRCNRAKGDMSDAAFRRLIAFLDADAELHHHVWRRLTQSGFAFAAFKRRG